MVWNCVLLGYRLKATYMSYQGHLKGKLGKILKIYTLTYLQLSYLQPLEIEFLFLLEGQTGKNPKNIYSYLLTTLLLTTS